MSFVTWSSSWTASADVNVQLASDCAVSLVPLPLHLTRSTDAVSVPCKLSMLWTQQPLRCSDLQLEVRCSARHVEIYAEGTRRTLMGEEELGEVYLGTFRGTTERSEPPLFAMSPRFKQSDRNGDVLKSVHALHVKFVSLMGDKNALDVHEFRCRFVPMEPVQTAELSAAELASTIDGGRQGGRTTPALDVTILLSDFQQQMEREMETKMKQVIDAKLSLLSNRLALSEQAIFQMYKKMDAKNVDVQDSLSQIRLQYSQLEDQLSQMSVVNEGKQDVHGGLDEMKTKTVEQASDEKLEGAPVAEEAVVADCE